MEQGKQASHYNRHLATNTSITAAEQGWRWARTHTSSKPLSRAMRFRMHCIGNFKREWAEKKGKQMALPCVSPCRGIEGHSQCLHTWRKSLFIRRCFMILFYFFFPQPCRDSEQPPFSTIIFYYRHEHDITSTETVCSSHPLHCITVINGDLNTLTRYS